jgi:hypothetical protein
MATNLERKLSKRKRNRKKKYQRRNQPKMKWRRYWRMWRGGVKYEKRNGNGNESSNENNEMWLKEIMRK